ncbi:MAG: hypothetical protein QM664_08510 [Flavihumibacter sp.]
MAVSVYLLTPPFTQLNTPYPATAYLKGFLNTLGISSYQSDLGIEVTDAIFCRQGLQQLFAAAEKEQGSGWNDNIRRIWQLRDSYVSLIDAVMDFYGEITPRWPTVSHNGVCCPKQDALISSTTSPMHSAIWAHKTKRNTLPPCSWKT